MKKLFSSTLSLLTAMAIIPSNAAISAYADAIDMIPVDAEITEEICIGDLADLELSYPDLPDIASNFADGTYNYSQFLDDNNKLVYNALKPLVSEPSLTPITVKLKNPVSITLSTLPSSPDISEEELEAYQNALFGSCKPGLDSLTFDYPELCWLDVTKIAVRPGNDTYISRSARKGTYTIKIYSVVVTPDYYDGFSDFDVIDDYLSELYEVVDDFKIEGDTRYEQIKSIHDQIALNTFYDLEAKFRGSALGALVEPGVVCEGYAKAFKIICDSVNIPCVVVFGNYDPLEDAAHMWNYLQMDDGKWYAIDVTWDDLDGENGQEIKYDYFIRGSKRFNTNHTAESDYNITYLTYPEISESDYKFTPSVTTTTSAATTTITVTTTEPETTTLTTSSDAASTEIVTTTTSKAATTTTKATTTTSKPTTTTTKATTTTSRPTTTTTKATTTTTKVPEPLIGDLNCDGEVNVADLVYCANTVLGKIDPEHSCDANNDKQTDVFDVIFMRKLVIKLSK